MVVRCNFLPSSSPSSPIPSLGNVRFGAERIGRETTVYTTYIYVYIYIYVGFRIDRYFCQRLSANLVDSFSRDFEESEERVRGWGGRIGWLENRFCRRVVAILLLPFPLQRADSFIFESAKIPSRIPSSNFPTRVRGTVGRVDENGRCLPKNYGAIVNPTRSFLSRHCSSNDANRTFFVSYRIVYIHIYNSLR